MVQERRLQTSGPDSNGYLYALDWSKKPEVLYRTPDIDWDKIPVTYGESADPAASAASITVYTCPANTRARFLSATQSYTRDANAANVLGILMVFDATGGSRGVWPLSAYMTAGVGWTISWGEGAIGASLGAYITGSIPKIELSAGDYVTVYWLNDQATDDGGVVRYAVKEGPA